MNQAIQNPGASFLTTHELEAWRRLAIGSGVPDPLSSGPEWQITARNNSRRRRDDCLVRIDGDSGLFFSKSSLDDLIVLGAFEAHWKFGSPVLGPRGLKMLMELISELKSASRFATIQINVPGLEQGGEGASALAAANVHLMSHSQTEQAAASLEGGLDGWLARRSPKFRRNLRRSLRMADSEGLTIERWNPEEGVCEQIYSRMLAVEQRSWKGAIADGLFALRKFYFELLVAYARSGMARVTFARIGDLDVGFNFGGAYGGIYRGQQTSYDQAYSALSIGSLMHFDTVRWLIEEEATLHHFGPVQGWHRYKFDWCEIITRSCEVWLDLSRS